MYVKYITLYRFVPALYSLASLSCCNLTLALMIFVLCSLRVHHPSYLLFSFHLTPKIIILDIFYNRSPAFQHRIFENFASACCFYVLTSLYIYRASSISPSHHHHLNTSSQTNIFLFDATTSESSANQLVKSARMLFLSVLVMSSIMAASAAGNFINNFEITWGNQNTRMLNGGQLLTLSLDKSSGSGFKSKDEYLFGRIDMQLKLVSGNSAGTVTAYYLSSLGPYHDEIDFEFLGNLTGQPYTLHTNVFSQGKGNREQQFHLWFDPTKNFHTYSIVWNPQRIIFLVDNTPIRVFENQESKGVPFPKNQPMRIYSSLWNADDWATQGGRVKTDWSKAPFTAYYRNFVANACVWSSSSSSCAKSLASTTSNAAWQTQGLDANGRRRLRWAQKYYMIYNYCNDYSRFPQGLPRECKRG